MAGQAGGPPAAPHSARLLGFAPDARLLIINSDDFRMYPAINTAVVSSIVEGIARSCSLMVPCPAARHAMHLLGHPWRG
jgi:chitin disaccharide deacetylase